MIQGYFICFYGFQGVPSERNGCSNETVHIQPHVGKPKCVWDAAVVFFKNCKQTAEKYE